jgi:hypothetical protein
MKRLRPAIGTEANEFQTIAHDLIAAEIILTGCGKIKGGAAGRVVHSAASEAPEVVVGRGVAVETGLAAGRLEFSDRAHLDQSLQVSVDGPQADFRDPATDKAVQFASGRMGLHAAQFLQNDAALPCVSLKT